MEQVTLYILKYSDTKYASSYLKSKYVGEHIYFKDGCSKPYSNKCYFNISHSSNYTVIALSDKYEIGVDIEKRKSVTPRLKKYISASEEEYNFIKDDDINFYKLWTNKEALVKCKGSGLDRRVAEIICYPIDQKREYQGDTYVSKTFIYNENVISVTLKSSEEFDIVFKEIEMFTHKIIVNENMSAKAVESGGLNVLATPEIIRLVEKMCYEYIEEQLVDELTTVGGYIDIHHNRPTAIGKEVEFIIDIKEKDEKKIVFSFSVREEGIVVAEGEHIRYIVNIEKFLKKIY